MTNAIETSNFVWNSELRENVKLKENITGNFNFISTGRFNTQKNHLFMLDVFAELVRQKPEAHLYLVGDGELRPEIEKKIADKKLQDKVHLLGVRDNIHELLQAMDYFLFPSLFEGLGIAFIEAQTAGLKCFISDGVPAEGILVEENVKVISLKKSAKEWSEIILPNLEYERKDTSQTVKDAGYDIVENAKKLEEKYLELLVSRSV
jgi:Glycosyltransferase